MKVHIEVEMIIQEPIMADIMQFMRSANLWDDYEEYVSMVSIDGSVETDDDGEDDATEEHQ